MSPTSLSFLPLETVRKRLEPTCPLSPLWMYRKGAYYYIRLRPKGLTKETVTISLRTGNRRYAMSRTREIQAKMETYHLGTPEATFTDLSVKLREITLDVMAREIDADDPKAIDAAHAEYSEWLHDLSLIMSAGGLTPAQIEACLMWGRIARGAIGKLRSAPEDLLAISKELSQVQPADAPVKPQREVIDESSALPFSKLSALYKAEQEGNVQASTLHEITSSCNTLIKELTDDSGVELDLRKHTREDMTDLKAKLLVGRKASTVNKLLTRFSTVMTWGVNNGYLERSFDKGLKIAKGADSTRKPFSKAQVQLLMEKANAMPVSSWERWAITLGAITGARIGEIYQLTTADVVKVGDEVVIDINMDDDKTLKNKHSRRTVPLIDGAYGFSLKDFMAFVDSCEVRLFTNKPHYFNKPLNDALRDILDLEAGGDYSFHSLRHSMSSLMRSMGIHSGIAGDILGHSTGTITFDLYGVENKVNVDKMVASLREAFSITK